MVAAMAPRPEIVAGTSGWHYRHWRGRFYPDDLAASRWLGWYAERFATVEVNASFYRLPSEDALRSWRAAVPDDFVFAVKASRYLTHVRRLNEPEAPVALLMGRAALLGPTLGPVLLQLPPDMTADAGRLDRTLAAFPSGTRVAVEPRHESWWSAEVRAVLEHRGASLCLSDRRGPLGPDWQTAEWGYVRFHAGRASPEPCYGRQALDTWAARLAGRRGGGQVFAFFNNDQGGCAPGDARRLAVACRRHGLRTARFPAAREVGHPGR
jgi:uncharacterized protein YecE (DUF72 family)